MKKQEIYKLINTELDWRRKSENQTMPEEWSRGFQEGLRQAKNLVKNYRNVDTK